MKFYNINEVAELLNVHANTVRNWLKSDQLKSYKFEKAVRISQEDLDEFLAKNKKEEK